MTARKHSLHIAALIGAMILTAAVYGNSLGNGFVYDDSVLVENNAAIRTLTPSTLLDIFSEGNRNYLPVRIVSYAVDYSIWGLRPAGFRITNLAFHALNVSLLMFLVLRVTARVSEDMPYKRRLAISVFGAILFCVHPLQVETVVWISGRKDLLATFFVLAGFHAYWTARINSRNSNALFLIVFTTFVLGMMSKASAVCFPLLLALSDFMFFFPHANRTRRARIIQEGLFLFAFMTVFMILDIRLSKEAEVIGGLHGGIWGTHIFTILKIPWLYLKSFFVPLFLSPEYDIPVSQSLFQMIVLVVATIFSLLAAAFCFRKSRLLFFFMAWFAVCLGPVSNIVPVANIIADRYAYMGMVGLCAFTAIVLNKTLSSKKFVYSAICIGVVICCSIITIRQNSFWKNELTLWTRALHIAPNKTRVHHNLGEHYRKTGDAEQAKNYFKEALRLDPGSAPTHFMLSQMDYLEGNFKDAIEHLKKAIERKEKAPIAHHNLATLYSKTGDLENCLEVYRKAVLLFPNDLSFKEGLLATEAKIRERENIAPLEFQE